MLNKKFNVSRLIFFIIIQSDPRVLVILQVHREAEKKERLAENGLELSLWQFIVHP